MTTTAMPVAPRGTSQQGSFGWAVKDVLVLTRRSLARSGGNRRPWPR